MHRCAREAHDEHAPIAGSLKLGISRKAAHALSDQLDWFYAAQMEEADMGTEGGYEIAAGAHRRLRDWFYGADDTDDGASSDDELAAGFPGDGRDDDSLSQGGSVLNSGNEAGPVSASARDAAARSIEDRLEVTSRGEPGVAETKPRADVQDNAAEAALAAGTQLASVKDTGGMVSSAGTSADFPQDRLNKESRSQDDGMGQDDGRVPPGEQKHADAGERLHPWFESMEGAIWAHNSAPHDDLDGRTPYEALTDAQWNAQAVEKLFWAEEIAAWAQRDVEGVGDQPEDTFVHVSDDVGWEGGAVAALAAASAKCPGEPLASARGLEGENGRDTEPQADALTCIVPHTAACPHPALKTPSMHPTRPPSSEEDRFSITVSTTATNELAENGLPDDGELDPHKSAHSVQLPVTGTPASPQHSPVLEGEKPPDWALQAVAARTGTGAAQQVEGEGGTDLEHPFFDDVGWSAQIRAERRPWMVTGDRGDSTATVARLASIRTILAMSAVLDLEILLFYKNNSV
ncbi:hypothetical protein HGRIS_001217 [Hohenbuehelia grisea]|uniref:Uncharacterized protein n=1 Tax=Hohenbuehelia grisea TaxID=104357 RepID=A0ABR3JPX2_9AGAR